MEGATRPSGEPGVAFANHAMTISLPLGYDEFRLIARRCRTVDVRRLPARFDFRGYLLHVLRPHTPALARQVERLTAGEVEHLRNEVAEFQDLAN